MRFPDVSYNLILPNLLKGYAHSFWVNVDVEDILAEEDFLLENFVYGEVRLIRSNRGEGL